MIGYVTIGVKDMEKAKIVVAGPAKVIVAL
jgi:hypothetical protein